jgi:hypothetical protein
VPASSGGEGHPRGVGGDVGEQLGAGGAPCWSSMMVSLSLGGELEHGLGEVAAAGGVHPAGAEDEVAAAALADESSPSSLVAPYTDSGPVGASSRGRRRCRRRRSRWSNARAARRGGGFAGEDAGGQRVEGAGEVGFALGLVDGGVGGGVDDEVGGDGAHGGGEAFGVGEVAGEAGAPSWSRATMSPRGRGCAGAPSRPGRSCRRGGSSWGGWGGVGSGAGRGLGALAAAGGSVGL